MLNKIFRHLESFCKGWKGLFLSAILVTLSIHPFRITPFLFIFMVPAMVAVSSVQEKMTKIKWSFLWGGLIGLFNFYWLVTTIHHYGRINIALSLVLFVPMLFYQTGPFIIWLSLFKRERILMLVFLFPVLFRFFPFIFPYTMAGFLSQMPILSQTADLTGEMGLDFILVLINCLIFMALTSEKKLAPIISVSMIIICIVGYGFYSLKFREFIKGNSTRILLLQPEIRDGDSDSQAESKFFKLIRESQHSAKGAVIILPESSIPERVSARKDFFEVMSTIVKNVDAKEILFNITVFRDGKLYNAEYLTDRNGEGDYYYKTRLMLFGEQFPFHSLIQKLPLYVANFAEFSPGLEIRSVSLSSQLKFATPICLEGIYENYTADLSEQAHMIINPTNDEWFGRTKATMLHFAQVRLKSVENRKYMLRAANTGYSVILNHKGEIIDDLPRDEQAYIAADIPAMEEKTCFQGIRIYIPWFFVLSLIFSGLFLKFNVRL